MVTAASAARPDAGIEARAEARLVIDAAGNFAALWNRQSFAFQHSLAHHPLFTLAALREVAARTPKYDGFVHWQNGRIDVTDTWGINTGKRLSLDETIVGIADNNSQVVLKHAEQDQCIGPILRALLTEVVDLAPASARDDITIGESIIFISSPRRVTKYHIDLETNCLLQVSGDKVVHVFDQSDRSILSLEEIEKQCCGNQDAAVFRPDRQNAARSYDFKPGVGAYFPSLAPHWVQNGDDVSISININFELRSVHHRLRAIHRFNRRLRRFGMTPSPPDRNSLLDGAKASIENGLIAARRALKPRPADSYPAWTPSRGRPRPPTSPQTIRSHLKRAALKTIGQLRAWADPGALPFRGAFPSYQAALASVRPSMLAGYDHDAVSPVSEEKMQAVLVWDYPVLYWLHRLAANISCVVDAGGHTGVKYRAFSRHLDLDRIDWVVFDLPTMVSAGRAKIRPEDRTLSFVERLEEAPAAQVLLASGLLQYVDAPLQDLVRRMRVPPEYILLNKVATRDGPAVVTLENLGLAEVPYQIRSREEIPSALAELGYDIIDEWVIPSFAHVIPTHPELGRSTSRGYLARLRRNAAAR